MAVANAAPTTALKTWRIIGVSSMARRCSRGTSNSARRFSGSQIRVGLPVSGGGEAARWNVMKRASLVTTLGCQSNQHQEAQEMLYAGLDLSRQRLDVHVLDEDGQTIEVPAVRPDVDALGTLAAHVLRRGQEVTAAIESMTGARFVHDTLEFAGWDVAIADAAKVKGIAPLAAKTDKIDARVLAELARRDLVPQIWLPTPDVPPARQR